MKKKYVLKKWVKVVLAITFIASLVLGSLEVSNFKDFIITKLIPAILLIIDFFILREVDYE